MVTEAEAALAIFLTFSICVNCALAFGCRHYEALYDGEKRRADWQQGLLDYYREAVVEARARAAHHQHKSKELRRLRYKEREGRQ